MGVAGLVVARRGRRLHEAVGEKRATVRRTQQVEKEQEENELGGGDDNETTTMCT